MNKMESFLSKKVSMKVVIPLILFFILLASIVVINYEYSQSDTKKETIVYVTKTGQKYHRGDCRYLRFSKIAIPLSKAKMNYSPCSICDPPY